MNTKKSYARGNFTSLVRVYLAGMACFTLFRLILLALNLDRTENIPAGTQKLSLLMQALWMGVRFDTVIACYILLFPTIITSAMIWFRRLHPIALRLAYLFVEILFVLSFLICTVDIPFFNQFFARLNHGIFLWTENIGVGLRMVVREPRFMGFAPLFIAVSTVYLLLMRRIRRRQRRLLILQDEAAPSPGRFLCIVGGCLLLWLIIFVGIRGRLARKSPIRVGTAYFSNYPFINQLGLNPVYSFMRSCLDAKKSANRPIRHIPDEEALKLAQLTFTVDSTCTHISPIARRQQGYPLFADRNLVLIIMEGMSIAKINHPEGLTPFINNLRTQCWSFDSVYSAGIHTFNGIYSTLFSHPALMSRHPMYNYFSGRMAGLPNLLAARGYQTAFFIPHDDQFDNVAGFLSDNGVNRIIAQKDYPASEVKSSMGVSDGYMFRFAIPHIARMADRGTPFCATFMTASDHPPYILPHNEGFEPTSSELPKQMTEYADWALGRFMADAARQSWYNNTVFVFVADHGGSSGTVIYDVNLDYHHIPFLIFAPGITERQRFGQIALQLDVFPTVVANMGISFVNNTFGIDLLHERRENIVFSTDDKLACMNDSLLYIYRTASPDGLYRYRAGRTDDCSNIYPSTKEKMRRTAFAWLQTSQWMIANGKAAIP